MFVTGVQALLKIKKLLQKAILPYRGSKEAAGLDLFSTIDITIFPGQTVEIPTGVAIELPPGTVGLIFDRSSFGRKSIVRLGGVIDADYRGEIIVLLHNLATGVTSGGITVDKLPYTIQAGDKIAQLLVLPYVHMEPYEVQELGITHRDTNGFGSTGV